MPVPGLSLVGFMDQPTAIEYLRKLCLSPDANDGALLEHWQAARRQLGPPMTNAGHPDMQEIPATYRPYLEGVPSNPRFDDTVGLLPWSFKLVEVDPLLAFQVHVSTSHAPTPGVSEPDLAQMLERCLPHGLESVNYGIDVKPNGFSILADSLNLKVLDWGGPLGHNPAQQKIIAGMVFGVASPLAHVVRLDGRCYLRNGFHRGYGFRRAGATHIPCLVLEGNDWRQVAPPGPSPYGRDLRALLDSADPPTCGHYTQGRAYPITLRYARRLINVTFNEVALLEP